VLRRVDPPDRVPPES